MKKIIIIIAVIMSMNLIYNYTHRSKPVVLKEQPMFKIDEYNVFYLDLSEEEITTLNLNKIVNKNMDLINIVLDVNKLYRDKIGYINYKYQNISFKRNMNKLTDEYVTLIKDKGFIDNFDYISVTGIKIVGIELYTSGQEIVDLLYKYPNIRYKDYLNNNYKYLKF